MSSYASSSYTSSSWGESVIDTPMEINQPVKAIRIIMLYTLHGVIGIMCIAGLIGIGFIILGIEPAKWSIFDSREGDDERDRRLYELLNDDL